MKYSRGSEWNRWEFHIHTPCTLKSDRFAGSTPEEKWNNFYQDILNYIGDGEDDLHRIVALGITDYLSIKNYNKVISDGILGAKIPFIFPNVEMRITPIAQSSPINIHCLFNPAIAHELEGRFFGKLKFDKDNTTFSALESELIRFGKSIDATLDDEHAKRKATEQFVIPYTQLRDLFTSDKDLRDNTLIAISNTTNDGASGIANASIDSDSQLLETRIELYRMSDMIFSGNDSDVKYFLGEKSDTAQTICRKYGKLMPCVIGCDAHKNSDIFEPDQKKYCWIKSIPSFEGMKEITFEPKSRVRIQELKPESKPDYYVIDSVLIDDVNFSSEPIPFSDQLTCIIGGKSTGKSLLLHNMAEAISPVQVKDKLEKTNSTYYKIDKIKVLWRDGVLSSKDTPDVEKKIVYLPQTYLNKLSDKSEEVTEIDEIIKQILLQNQEIESWYQSYSKEIEENKKQIDKKIYDLLADYRSINKLKAEKLEKGDTISVEKQIVKLKSQKDKLIQENSLSEEDIKSYEQLLKTLSTKKAEINKLETDIFYIQEIDNLVESTELPDEISPENLKQVKKYQSSVILSVKEQWLQKREVIITAIDKKIHTTSEQISEIEKKITKLKPKVESNASISQITKEIAFEEQKLDTLRLLDSQLERLQASFTSNLDQIAHLTLLFYNEHNKFATKVNERSDIHSDELEFIVSAPFRTDAFYSKIEEIVDNRKIKQFFEADKNNEIEFYANDFDEAFVRKGIVKFLDNDLGLLKKSTSQEDAIRHLASDWYNITYDIRLDGDEIEKMSPGKKALVLLKLLINLAESKCPILIDQPEDDLDNRSVYTELVDFIRTKKINRQIILVTHNANIVVGCDSEEVIVANQNGNNSPNMEKRFEYRTGAIEDIHPLKDENGDVYRGVLYQTGIQQHICQILEGGKEAFNVRKKKYTIEK